MPDALILACPDCNTLNRFPRDKLAAGNAGKCGQCGSPLFAGHPVALDARSFEAHAAKSDIPVLVDFWAEWCGPCKMIGPSLEEISEELGEQVTIAKLNIDENPDAPGKYGVRGIPTMILFKNGEVADTKVGAAPKSALKGWLEGEL